MKTGRELGEAVATDVVMKTGGRQRSMAYMFALTVPVRAGLGDCGAPTTEGDLAIAETSGFLVPRPGRTTAMLEASGTKSEIVVCLDLVLGVLERAKGAEEREIWKGEEKRPVVETKIPADDLNFRT